jgi:hypothetical protein
MRIDNWNGDAYVFTGLYSNEAATVLNFIFDSVRMIGACKNITCGGFAMRYPTGEIIIMTVYRGWAESVIDNLKAEAKEILTIPNRWLLHNTKSDVKPWFWNDVVDFSKIILNRPIKKKALLRLVGHSLNPLIEAKVAVLLDEYRRLMGTLDEHTGYKYKKKAYDLVVEAMANGN